MLYAHSSRNTFSVAAAAFFFGATSGDVFGDAACFVADFGEAATVLVAKAYRFKSRFEWREYLAGLI